MAEVQSRSSASRGRGSTRGRGGFSSRGGRSSAPSRSGNTSQAATEASLDSQGELGQLKKQYRSQLSTVKEVFPDWTDDDIVFALQETNGDVQSLIERISEGNVFQFEDVKKKPREKSRVKETVVGDGEVRATSSVRGARGRTGAEAGRGGRGRGSERGRGGARGGRGGAAAAINGSRAAKPPVSDTTVGWDQAPAADVGSSEAPAAADAWDSVPAASDAWDDTAKPQTTTKANAWPTSAAPVDQSQPSGLETQKSSSAADGAQKKSWASMFAKPNPPPAVPKPTAAPAPKVVEPPAAADDAVAAAQAAAAVHSAPTGGAVEETAPAAAPSINATDLAPPQDPLTEENVEHLPDTSGPRPSATVASTRGEPHSAVASVKASIDATGHVPAARPSFGNLHKAATHSNRSLSFQRLKAQQDAVVMPGNHAVDRAAVQFGQMGLGNESGKPLDVDDDREDAETRTQPPQQSPSAPRASLPPAARAQQALTEQAPGMSMSSQQQGAGASLIAQIPGSQGLSHARPEPPGFDQFGRYGAGGAFGQGQGAPPQKEYDPFSSQLNAAGPTDTRSQYPGHSQAPGGISQQASAYGAGYNQGPTSYDSHYGADQGRYSNYYGYAQQGATSAAENQAPQRSTSGLGDHSYGATANATQSRFSEGQVSGNNTPNPPMGTQSHQNQHVQGHAQSNYGAGHPFGGGSPYGYYGYGGQYPGQSFGNHYGYGQGGYGGNYGKGGMYGQSHHGYGMSSQGSFDHSSSPANAGTFAGSSLPGREGGMSSTLNEYSRSGSTQPTGQSQNSSTGGGFGGGNESYGRSSSGFGGHSQSYGASTSGTAEESLKALHDPKTGPSPALGSNNRPGSGFNANNPGYGPPQSNYSGSGGFPGQLNQLQSQYGGSGYGLGGLGGHGGSQGHQGHQGGYGGYGGFGQGGSNYGSGARGGWGSQYSNQYGQH